MSIIDHVRCGKVIVFNSMLAKERWAFCIDYNYDEQIIYRGFFGLKAIDRKTFFGFARIVDIFDYLERIPTADEEKKLKCNYKTGSLMKTCKDVKEFVDQLFRSVGIRLFVNPEGGGTFHDTKTK